MRYGLMACCCGLVAMMLLLAACGGQRETQEQASGASHMDPKVRSIMDARLNEPLATKDGTKLFVLEVHGMTCESCAMSVRARLAELEGVEQVSVNVADKRAWVRVATTSDTTAEIAAAAVTALQFPATVQQ